MEYAENMCVNVHWKKTKAKLQQNMHLKLKKISPFTEKQNAIQLFYDLLPINIMPSSLAAWIKKRAAYGPQAVVCPRPG